MFKQTLCATATCAALLLPTASSAAIAAAPPVVQEAAPEAEAPPSADFVLANLDSVSPLNLIYVASEQWSVGNRLQAAFWYYIWQIRTESWAVAEAGFSEPRAAINQSVGTTINGWIFSDPELMYEISERAIGYEAKLPLWSRMPEGVTEAQWAELIASTRATYARDLQESFVATPPDRIRELRRQNGLAVGPLPDEGAPLPEEWR